jgi:hypothetical protein
VQDHSLSQLRGMATWNRAPWTLPSN